MKVVDVLLKMIAGCFFCISTGMMILCYWRGDISGYEEGQRNTIMFGIFMILLKMYEEKA